MTSSVEPTFTQTGNISDDLDRLEVLAGKIGMNTPAQALDLLSGLDRVYAAIDMLDEQSTSRKVVETQFNIILSRLHHESAQFIRDLGGVQALRQAREEAAPPAGHSWWFIDAYLGMKRRSQLRRYLVIAGIAAVVITLLVVLYQAFLAPDPQVAAIYGAEQSARDSLQTGDLTQALSAVEEGLKVDPNEPTLLTYRGIINELQGPADQAIFDFSRAEKGFGSREAFLVTRGEGYAMAGHYDKAMIDAQEAVKIDSQSARGYLLIGQVYEAQNQIQEALEAYNQAYTIADQTDQLELAAIARTRTAFLMQMMQMPGLETQTPVP